jgi:hypothetical protein
MGNYSFFLTTRNNAKDCKINWQQMDTELLFKFYPLKCCYEAPNQHETLEDVAKSLDETKFIGYLTDGVLMALKEFSCHLIPYGCFPRLYYRYEGDYKLWCFEFIPGTDIINILTSPYTESCEMEEILLIPDQAVWKYRYQL